jgi:hypothetical protein
MSKISAAVPPPTSLAGTTGRGGRQGGGGDGGSSSAMAATGPTVVVSVPSDDKIELVTNVRRGWTQPSSTTTPSAQATVADPSGSPRAASSTPATAPAEQHHNHEKGQDGLEPTVEVDDDFEDLDISDQVPLGDILDKLEDAAAAAADSLVREDEEADADGNLIRLHVKEDLEDEDASHGLSPSTISATVNVATLDLSDPDSIHHHLTQLNDTVLKVTASTSSFCPDSVAASLALALGGVSPNYDSPTSPTKLETSSISSSSAVSMQSGSSCYLSPPPPPLPQQQQLQQIQHPPQQGLQGPLQSNPPPALSPSVVNSALPLPTSPVSLPQPAANVGLPTSPLPMSVAVAAETPPPVPPFPRTSNAATTTVKGGKSGAQVCATCSKQFSNASALAKHR